VAGDLTDPCADTVTGFPSEVFRMTRAFRSSLVAATTMLAWSSVAGAQSPPVLPSTSQAASFTGQQPDEMRPTTNTFLGDTGIWYVPTAEILRSGTWSIGGDRRGTNYVQGLTNVADFAGTAAIGIGNRAEVFGSFLFDTRIDRANPPVFANDARQGGIVARYPRVNESWTGNQRGDFYVGSKVNLLSQYRNAPVALAVRGIVKLPTGDTSQGTSTGKTDVMADLIVSKELNRFFEAATFVGMERRGNPDGFDAPKGSYRWGTGVTFPSRSPLRLSAEANGDLPTSYRATLTDNSVVGDDGSVRPLESDIRNRTRLTGGVTYQMPAGFFMGTGLSWNAPRYWDWQFRVGYHGRGRIQPRSFASAAPAVPFVPEAPASVPDPVIPAPPAPVAREEAPRPAPAAAPVQALQSFEFEDVFFNLDGYTLRPGAAVILDAAVKTLQTNPTMNITIEGHTCDLGTSEYNIGLAERRADTVRDYFVSRGISAGRLRTASYGEENPEHANIHEEARRLNRRVALVVRLES
jgi:outer membrane protein OmpA-like peptidoglycan-associated protein